VRSKDRAEYFVDHSINRSINQSIELIDQSIDHSITQSIDRSIDHSIRFDSVLIRSSRLEGKVATIRSTEGRRARESERPSRGAGRRWWVRGRGD